MMLAPKRRLAIVLLFLTAVASAETAEDADSLFEQAGELFGKGAFSEVIPLLGKAAEIDAALGKARLTDLAYDRKYLGISFDRLGQGREAHAQLALSLEIFTALDAPEEQAFLLNYIGWLEYSRAEYPRAEERFKTALAIVAARGVEGQRAAILNNLGLLYSAWGRYDEAIARYSLARAEHETRGDRASAAANLGNIAGIYLAWGRYGEAEEVYRQTLAEFQKIGDQVSAANTMINLGMTASARGGYDDARAYLEQALQTARSQGLKASEANALGSLGSVLYATGRYDEAESAYARAQEMFAGLDMRLNVVSMMGSLGMVYQAWGRFEKALALLERALALARALGAPDQALANLRFIGSVRQNQGKHEEAIAKYQEGLEMAVELGRQGDQMLLLNAMGAAYAQEKIYDKAEELYRQALELGERLGKRDETARVLIHMGGVSQIAGKVDAAREQYERALAMCRAIGMRAEEATALNNLGTLFLQIRDPARAREYLQQAVAIKEELRRTASGAARRDFLASWISSYRWLIQAHHAAGDAAAVFDSAELVKARYLAEQISTRLPDEPQASGIRALQSSLGTKTAVVSFANVDWQHPLAIFVDRDTIRSYELDPSASAPKPLSLAGSASPTTENARGFVVVDAPGETRSPIAAHVEAYRWLLTQSRLSTGQLEARKAIARGLHDLLLGPIAKELADKDELIIIPDGSLGILPFEALILPDGRWLVERFHVTYLPSLTVKGLLDRRSYPPRPRPLLALGGARYAGGGSLPAKQPGSQPAAQVSTQQLQALRADAARLLGEGKSARAVYAALGLGWWPDLPGTLAEVASIGKGVPGSVVLTGADASERMVKQISRDRALGQYRVLHFATHGVMVPAAPELAAIVLSEAGSTTSNEDGYLTMDEIATLGIQADFVDLSACETGLGRIYAGEGVVGLTQAFIVAGANGLSVSLWQVADDSTRELMVGMYRLVTEQGLSYARAMTEMKRAFIKDGAYQAPFYWAPFIYYGR
jgi:CHAT domain-containing protein/tetratricopeptide (TPR) repeat protein